MTTTERSYRILIADDVASMRVILDKLLKKMCHEVVGEAANGVEAVAMYREHHPDLVTMDLMMPEMDGMEAIREIRGSDPDARILVVSALDTKDMIEEAIEAGALGYVTKPYSYEKLRIKIDDVMGKE